MQAAPTPSENLDVLPVDDQHLDAGGDLPLEQQVDQTVEQQTVAPSQESQPQESQPQEPPHGVAAPGLSGTAWGDESPAPLQTPGTGGPTPDVSQDDTETEVPANPDWVSSHNG